MTFGSWDADGSISISITFLGQDSCNEVQHDFLAYVTPLVPALASCDTHTIVSSTIAFIAIKSR